MICFPVENIGVEPMTFPALTAGTLWPLSLPTLQHRLKELESCGEYRSRTDDLLLAKQAL